MDNDRTSPGAGFTLVELLITVSILAILAAIILPVYTSHQTQTQAAVAAANKKAVEAKVQQYFSENNSYLAAIDAD